MHGDANRISEVGIQRHSRRQRNGIVGIQSHHQRSHRGRDAGREDHPICRHPRLSENLGIHHNDVSHRDESGEAAQHLLLDRRLILGEFKVAIDQLFLLAKMERRAQTGLILDLVRFVFPRAKRR